VLADDQIGETIAVDIGGGGPGYVVLLAERLPRGNGPRRFGETGIADQEKPVRPGDE
jgi:hypothetical protein